MTDGDPRQEEGTYREEGEFRMYDIGSGGGSMSARDVTGLVTLFVSMLASTKAEILAAMKENSEAASRRWQDHEREHISQSQSIEKIEVKLDEHIKQATAYWNREHDAEVATQARVRPLKQVVNFVAMNWKTILLFLLALFGLMGISVETYRGIFGVN